MRICQEDGLDVLEMMTVSARMAPAITWLDPLRFFSLGLCKRFGLCLSSAHKRSGIEAENFFSVRDCYRRHAAVSLG